MKNFIAVIFAAIIIVAVLSISARGKSDFDSMYRSYKDTDMAELKAKAAGMLQRESTDSALAVFTIMANRDVSRMSPVDKVYMAEARNSLGVLHFLKSNYTGAYSNLIAATQMDHKVAQNATINLAALYQSFGQMEKAYGCLRKVFGTSVDSGYDYQASFALINILTDFGDDVVAPDTVRHLINVFKANVEHTDDNPAWLLAHHISEARLHEYGGRTSAAAAELRHSVDASSSLLLPKRFLFASNKMLGELFMKEHMADSAAIYLLQAEKIAKENGFNDLLSDVYSALGSFYSTTGDNHKAEEYRNKYLELADSSFNVKEFAKIYDLELFYEAEKFEKRIQKMVMDEKIRNRTLCITVVALAILAGLFVYILVQNRRLKARTRSLFDKNVELIKIPSPNDTVISVRIQPERGGFPETSEKETVEKYTNAPISDESRQEILDKINVVFVNEEIFCKSGFGLGELANIVGFNQKYVSQVINETLGKTFPQLLNEKRIAVACRCFMDSERYGHMTMEAIVHQLGFKSRSTFSKTFKAFTGLTPSEFMRQARHGTTKQGS